MSDQDKAELLDLIASQKDQLIELREQLAAQSEHLVMLSERFNDEDKTSPPRKIVFLGEMK